MSKKNNPKYKQTIIFIIVALLVTVIIFIIFAANSTPGSGNKYEFGNGFKNSDGSYTLSIVDGEALALSSVRYAIAQSAVDGTGTITKQTCETLESIAKNYDNSAVWFSSCDYSMTGSIPDTSEAKILKLSDGDYCATFSTDVAGNVLTEYDFADGRCGDARIGVE